MRMTGAWLGLIGGLLWAAKTAFDWLGLGREVNRGYPPSHLTDYVEFIIPLLCIGSMYPIFSRYRAHVGNWPLVVSIGLILIGLFHIGDAYIMNSPIPFGLVFLFTGNLFMLLGLYRLAIRLGSVRSIPRVIMRLVVSLFFAVGLFCLSPFVSGSFANETMTAITVGLSIIIGLNLAAIGAALALLEIKNSAARNIVV